MFHCPARLHGPKQIFLLVFLLACAFPGTAFTSGDKTGILLVAFGTSVPEAATTLDHIRAAYEKAFPGCPVVMAYTSRIIRNKLDRGGIHVPSISEGLDQLAKNGALVVRVQSLHIMAGEEFAALARSLLLNIKGHPGRFRAVYLGRPLLESRADARAVARAVLGFHRKKGAAPEALILMGHGQEQGRADLIFEGARATFRENDPLVFMATVEGARTFDDMLKDLGQSHVKKVVLAPFMLVAGDHARNDLGGAEDDSWASRLKAAGYDVEIRLNGLGDVPGIDDIFIKHTKDSTDDLMLEPQKP